MQALSESANSMLQVSQDGIIAAEVEAVPKVWHGLTVLHEQSSHIKVDLRCQSCIHLINYNSSVYRQFPMMNRTVSCG